MGAINPVLIDLLIVFLRLDVVEDDFTWWFSNGNRQKLGYYNRRIPIKI